jgi:type 1 fimbriae regulatory protein FimB
MLASTDTWSNLREAEISGYLEGGGYFSNGNANKDSALAVKVAIKRMQHNIDVMHLVVRH